MTSTEAAAIAHGAATIVNAIATGKGAAFGVDLWTKAEVKLTSEPGVIRGEIQNDPSESTVLIEHTVALVLSRFNAAGEFGATVKTTSNIPIARGLKSSSAAANAVVLATSAALDNSLSDLDAVNLGVNAAFDAKVTVTGAFDDACASYFGGVVVTDNLERKLLSQTKLPQGLSVLFHVPPKKAYTADSKVVELKRMAPLVNVAFREAERGSFWTALTLNGLIYSHAIGFDIAAAQDALAAGAVGAGLCGKGPAVTAVVPDDRVEEVKAALSKHEGDVVLAKFNGEKAGVEK